MTAGFKSESPAGFVGIRMPGGLALLHPDHPVARAFRRRVAVLDLHASGAVLARTTAGLTLVHHAELPSYDPVPVGVIS